MPGFFNPHHFPWLEDFQPRTIPLVYDESISITQQLARMNGDMASLDANKMDLEHFQEFYNWLLDTFSDFEAFISHQIGRSYHELVKKLTEMKDGELSHDTTYGLPTDSITAMRDMFNDLAICGITVDELASLPCNVDEIAECGLNCRGLAMYSNWLIDHYRPDHILVEDCEIDGSEESGEMSALTVRQLAQASFVDDKLNALDREPLTVGMLASSDILNNYFVKDDEGTNSTVNDIDDAETDELGFVKVKE